MSTSEVSDGYENKLERIVNILNSNIADAISSRTDDTSEVVEGAYSLVSEDKEAFQFLMCMFKAKYEQYVHDTYGLSVG